MFYRVKQAIPAVVLVCATVLGGGCTKETQSQKELEPVSVNFHVSPVTFDVEEITKSVVSGEALAGTVHTIGYKIFKTSTMIAQGEVSFDPATEEAPEGFGTIQAKVMPGTYQIYFYAYGGGTGAMQYKGRNGEDISQQSSAALDQIAVLGSDVEVYSSISSYTVGISTSDISVTLPRTCGKLTIKATDKAPSEVAKITYSAIDKAKPLDGVSNVPVYQQGWAANPTISQGTVSDYSRFIPNPVNPTTLTIRIYDSSETLLREFTANVPIYKNRNTIVSGAFFSNLGELPLTIKIEDAWGEDYNFPLQ